MGGVIYTNKYVYNNENAPISQPLTTPIYCKIIIFKKGVIKKVGRDIVADRLEIKSVSYFFYTMYKCTILVYNVLINSCVQCIPSGKELVLVRLFYRFLFSCGNPHDIIENCDLYLKTLTNTK